MLVLQLALLLAGSGLTLAGSVCGSSHCSDIVHGWASCVKTAAHGKRCEYTCDRGYELSSDRKTRKVSCVKKCDPTPPPKQPDHRPPPRPVVSTKTKTLIKTQTVTTTRRGRPYVTTVIQRTTVYETVTTATPTTVTTTKITGPPVYTTTLTSPLPTTITITATTSMASPTTMAPGGTAASTASCAAFTPTNTAPPATYKGDAFYDVSEADLYAGLFCVGGVESVTNPILLVPGTGNDGAQSWQDGYEILYGNLGYDVCWVSPPPFMMGDSQMNAEYVAYAQGYLYCKTGKPLPIQGWSQGNLVIQWALTFWPSLRTKTKQFISLAGDFKGTAEGPFVEAVQLGQSAASVKQQTVGSTFLTNLAAKGGLYDWVPTTSIYSVTDEVIQPEPGPNNVLATSFLGGSRVGNIFAQQFCPLIVILHGQELYINFSYQVAAMALASSTGFVTPADVAAALAAGNIDCSENAAPGLTPADVLEKQAAFAAAAANLIDPAYFVGSEPAAKAYIASFPNNNRAHD